MSTSIITKLAAVLTFIALAVLGYAVFRHRNVPHVTETPSPKAPQRADTSGLLRSIQSGEQRTHLRILLIGWDAADWQIAEPLMKAGRMPTLQRLVRSGSSAFLHSYSPMLSPLLWTSIATGKAPSEHGILDFLLIDSKTGKPAPMRSTSRKTMALWNMLSEANRKSAWVAWWATWPAEPVNGVMVSDRVSYSLFSSFTSNTTNQRLTWPEDYYARIKPRLISENEITNGELAKFVHLAPSDLQQERTRQNPGAKSNPISNLAKILSSTQNYYKITQDLLSRQDYDLVSCYFEGIDQVGHLFQHCMPPKMSLASAEEYSRYKDVVPVFYEYLDRLTGELLSQVDSNTVVILVSDHGFKNGAGRPVDFPPYISERPAYWHRDYGIFVLSGGPVRAGRRLDTVELFDIAPTILYLLGLPAGKDMPGKVITEAINPDFLASFPRPTIPSWDPLRRSEADISSNAMLDSEQLENLQALGYIGQGVKSLQSPGKETAAYHRNLATIYLHDHKLDLAEKEIQSSMSDGAVFEAYELLSEVYRARGNDRDAESALQDGVNRFPGCPGEAILKLIALQLKNGNLQAARDTLRQHGSLSQKFQLLSQGMIDEAAGDPAAAEAAYLTALKLDPSFKPTLERLYMLYKSAGTLEKLEAPAKYALQINDQLAVCHNVLGVVYKKRGRFPQAIQEYQAAINLDPDNTTYLANLGAAYLSMQNFEQALQVLLRARDKNPKDPEVWINLGAVYGEMAENEKGLQAFEEARKLGADSPNIDLGAAAILAQQGKIEEAKSLLKRSMARYPGNQDLKDLFTVLQQERR